MLKRCYFCKKTYKAEKSRQKFCSRACFFNSDLLKNNGRKKTHGHTSDSGKVLSKTYVTWLAMKQRCLNEKHTAYSRYGGRGIKICNRWKNSFVNFLEDMGERPKNKTLDRINTNGNYNPKNCKWSTPKEQSRNMRNNIIITFKGKTMCASDWAEKFKVTNWTIITRYRKGLPIDKKVKSVMV